MATTLPPYREIPLTRSLVALVDSDLYATLAQHRWYATDRGYAAHHGRRRKSEQPSVVYMHREVLRLRGIAIPLGMDTDHINRCRADNRSENLRVVPKWINARNAALPPTNKSGYRGVCRHENGRWAAYLRVRGEHRYLGLFSTPEEASAAYQAACLRVGAAVSEEAAPVIPPTRDVASLSRAQRANNKSGYRGVSWNKQVKAWMAVLQVRCRRYRLGYFSTPEEASTAYAQACREHGVVR